MIEAVNVPFTSGDTNTADAIFLARTQLFNQLHGDRPNSPNILILLTDGMSSNSTATWQESSRARASGINIITVGVGQDIDMNELIAVATSTAPSSPQSNVFVASNYSTLSTQLTNNLSSAICSDFRHCNASSCQFRGQCVEEFGGFSCRCTTGYTGIYCERGCSGQLDLMIVVDLSGSIRSDRFKYIQQLLIGIIRNLDLGQFMTRVGIIVFSDDAQLSIRLNDYWNMQDLITAIYKIVYRGQRTNTAAALNLLRTQAFTATNGDRSGVPNVAIIVSDGNSNINPSSTVDEAIACRQAGIRLVTASLGDSINMAEIKNIASFPIEFNAYNVTNYTLVDNLIQLAVQSTCDSNNKCQSNTCQNGGTCVPLFNFYQCKCPRFYAGVNCERNCTVRSDVTIVLDFSGSIGYMEDWYNMLVSFAREVINGLDVDNDVARVAVVAYATDVIKTIYFNEYANNRAKLLEALAFYYAGGTTNTQAALSFVASSVFDANRGYRGFDSGVLKSVILLSDGESNVQAENTVPAANSLKRLGARVYSVIVGTDFNAAEMERISSNGTMYTYRMPHMADVKKVASQFLNDNCRV
ncbi:hypothetical protein HELRODRAFT_104083 [Helobdella robusta]|uniref:Uncharacterized protein n=1 Tax=Helobdella robusta TaxID=6412 RepID=T1EDJ5_HELRO|nr:hypothetical protein HELRODRAFT_104083 [Helobdella robusta]ESN92083.1 hypothetical protein HELRODRAFT_104083 [Helobdella robusta]